MSVVYVIAADPAGPVKIGVAGNPDCRCRALQSGNPTQLSVYVTLRASYRVEQITHRALEAHRLVGEWFDVSVATAAMALAETERLCAEHEHRPRNCAIFHLPSEVFQADRRRRAAGHAS